MCAKVIDLSKELIAINSVTPDDNGAIALVMRELESLGFKCHRYNFDGIENLFARLGEIGPNLCFAGHTDVVPTGDLALWKTEPFTPTEIDGNLYGRGAADMKTAIAAFIEAIREYIADGFEGGSISLMITGDEEGTAINGTKRLLPEIAEKGIKIDHCIVGEPTCPKVLGDMIKNGRRGSINTKAVSVGKQGHVAYPEKSKNPIPALIEFLHVLETHVFDEGAEGFQPTNLEIVTIDVGNKASNVTPQSAEARFNIRFNTNHSGESLKRFIEETAAHISKKHGNEIVLEIAISGEPFFTKPCKFTEIIQNAAEKITQIRPELSTTGGTSDARFIKDYCPVCEFGIVGATLHQINENVLIDDIIKLKDIYKEILVHYFEEFGQSND